MFVNRIFYRTILSVKMATGNYYKVYSNIEKGNESGTQFNSPLVIVPDKSLSVIYILLKNLIDYAGAFLGLVISVPVALVLIVIIKFTSKGSIIYKQERIGQFGNPFFIYKFRSMYENSEKLGPVLSSKHDERVTSVGRFMRRWRLDEIPNFINVFKGDMSLVGPRPERQFYIDQIVKITPEYIKLLQFKPGVTSLGEVEFGYAENVDEMIERMYFDLSYIRNVSIIKDLTILIRSVQVVLKGKGV